jgi:hypothetical protein
MSFFWVVTPRELVGRYQRLGETYCLQLLLTSPHGVTTQKNNIDISTSVRTSNPIQTYQISKGLIVSKLILTQNGQVSTHGSWDISASTGSKYKLNKLGVRLHRALNY